MRPDRAQTTKDSQATTLDGAGDRAGASSGDGTLADERGALDRRSVLALAALGATGAALGVTQLVQGTGAPTKPPIGATVKRDVGPAGSTATTVPSPVTPSAVATTPAAPASLAAAPPTTAAEPFTLGRIFPTATTAETSSDDDEAMTQPVLAIRETSTPKAGSETNFGVPVEPATLPAPIATATLLTAGSASDARVVFGEDGEPQLFGIESRTADGSTDIRGVALPVDKTPPNGVRAHARLLANRATFGPTPGLIAEIDATGPTEWIDAQLNPASIPDPAVDAAISNFWMLHNADHEQAFDNGKDVESQLYWATVARALSSERQLHEIMVQFWREHFSITLGMGQQPHYLFQDRYIRTHALGRFQDLLRESAHHAGMLIYLNNDTSNASTAQGVNENYGRELLELHSLGIIDGAHVYSEADVQAAAQVMSGFTTKWGPWSEFRYKPEFHYNGPISFLGGQWSTTGNGGDLGYDDGVRFLRFLSRHQSTARHICTKLVRFFVDENAPQSLVDSATAVYQNNQTNIAPVVRHILLSAEFKGSTRRRAKRGSDWVFSSLRAAQAQVNIAAEWHGWDGKTVPGYLNTTGHSPWGWSAPNGFPVENSHWLSTSFLQTRWNRSPFVAQSHGCTLDPASILPAGTMSATDFARGIGKRLCGMAITQPETDAFLQYMGKGPNQSMSAADVQDPQDVFAMFLMFPTFQLRG